MPRLMLSDNQYEWIAPLLPGKVPTRVGPHETIDRLSRPCYGSRAPAAHGAICRPISERGIACTHALPDGLGRKYGRRYSPSLRATLTLRKSSLTVRLCVPTSMPPVRGKGDRAIGRSRSGVSAKIHALVDGLGMLARFHLTGGQSRDSAFAGRTETRQSAYRRGLRYKRNRATSQAITQTPLGMVTSNSSTFRSELNKP
ncbi:hypothetical protein AWB69_09125 [Caballeronia udeis]|uniref:Transposase n=1 Tax=Caballeronia udeis TaxID=1232866 RepID=A0A158JZ76_9BURK|nr:hypothetical protein AWB69_09125 [Caballeronia udeis]